jgi:hypothetical protein
MLEREAQMLEMRKMGYTYSQIAERYKISTPKAYRIVQRAIDRYRAKVIESAEQLLQMELMRLDALLVTHMPRALDGDHQSAKRVIEIIALQAKLLGLEHAAMLPADVTVTLQYAASETAATG